MTTYYIKNWGDHFETAQSRKCASLTWVALPNKHDGKSYRRLMRMPNGPALYGAWVLIVQVASKCPVRGVLEDSDGPLTPEDISDKTDAPVGLIAEALEVLSGVSISWLGRTSDPDSESSLPACYQRAPSTLLAASSTLPTHNRTGPDRTEHNITQPDRTGPGKPGGFRSGWESPNVAVLKSPPKLLAWAETEGRKAGLDPSHPECRLRIFAAASRAVRVGKRPSRLFASLIQDLSAGDAGKLIDEDIDAGKLALRVVEGAAAAENPIARRLADAMGNGKPST